MISLPYWSLDAAWVECVGGPLDGAAVRVPAGADPVTLNGYAYRRAVWTERARGLPTWERAILLCEGPACRASAARPAAPEPARDRPPAPRPGVAVDATSRPHGG